MPHARAAEDDATAREGCATRGGKGDMTARRYELHHPRAEQRGGISRISHGRQGSTRLRRPQL